MQQQMMLQRQQHRNNRICSFNLRERPVPTKASNFKMRIYLMIAIAIGAGYYFGMDQKRLSKPSDKKTILNYTDDLKSAEFR